MKQPSKPATPAAAPVSPVKVASGQRKISAPVVKTAHGERVLILPPRNVPGGGGGTHLISLR